jgi:2,5-furandicarboxylate decarboxylase 1
VRDALAAGPLYFMQIMEALGSKDGREVALQLDALAEEGRVGRTANGEWTLK